MKGDILVLQAWHRRLAGEIVAHILDRVKGASTRYAMAVAGESGSGKSEIGQAISEELAKHGITSVVLGQDDYFVLPPKSNDQERRRNPDWLGPHVEVRLDVLEHNLASAMSGQDNINKRTSLGQLGLKVGNPLLLLGFCIRGLVQPNLQRLNLLLHVLNLDLVRNALRVRSVGIRLCNRRLFRC